jgi:hypothetical protein
LALSSLARDLRENHMALPLTLLDDNVGGRLGGVN